MAISERRDAVVVGAGPSGLFAALELARNGGRVTVLEQGQGMADSLCPKVRAVLRRGGGIREAEHFRHQCPRCDCLVGVGGAAFHFDTNLGYARFLSRSKLETAEDGSVRCYSSLERVVGSFQEAEALTADVHRILAALGLEAREPDEPDVRWVEDGRFVHVDAAPSLQVTVEDALGVISALQRELAQHGAELLLGTRAEDVLRRAEGGWVVQTNGGETLEAQSVVIAVGKSALSWVRGLLGRVGAARRPAARIDLGLRLETHRADLEPFTRSCHNPKLAYLNARGEPVRTFCVCTGGRLMQYEMAGVTILDGQHCLRRPTERSNLGILTTVGVNPGEDGTDRALEYAQRVNGAAGGGVLVQRVGDFLDHRPTPDGTRLSTSLVRYTAGDLRTALEPGIAEDVAGMLERLEATSPGCIAPDGLLAAPVIERLYPDIELSTDLESTLPGLFFVGDSSGKLIGIVYGAATGLRAARGILRRAA